MTDDQKLKDKLLEALEKQSELQQSLIEAQEEIINLRKEIENLSPTTPDKDVNWHHISDGRTSEEVLRDAKPDELRKFREWIFTFGEKYVKPYVHSKTYSELMAQMTRGLSHQMAVADMREEFGELLPDGKTVQFNPRQAESPKAEPKQDLDTKEAEKKPEQKRLIED